MTDLVHGAGTPYEQMLLALRGVPVDPEVFHDPDSRRYIWLDEDGVRCSPRHTSIKTALSYRRAWEPDGETEVYASENGGRPQRKPAYSGKPAPSEKEPLKLVVVFEQVRELTEDEEIGAVQLANLIAKGWV